MHEPIDLCCTWVWRPYLIKKCLVCTGKEPTPVKNLNIVKPSYGKMPKQTPMDVEPIDPSLSLIDISRVMSLREDKTLMELPTSWAVMYSLGVPHFHDCHAVYEHHPMRTSEQRYGCKLTYPQCMYIFRIGHAHSFCSQQWLLCTLPHISEMVKQLHGQYIQKRCWRHGVSTVSELYWNRRTYIPFQKVSLQ